MKFLTFLIFFVSLTIAGFTPTRRPLQRPTIRPRGPSGDVFNKKWAGMVVKQPTGQEFGRVEGTFQVPSKVIFGDGEGSRNGYNMLTIFLGIGGDDTTPEIQAAISLTSLRRHKETTTFHHAWSTISSSSSQEPLSQTQFPFDPNDYIHLTITQHSLSFENLSNGHSYTRNLTGTGTGTRLENTVTGQSAYWLVQEEVSEGMEMGDFGVVKWTDAKGRVGEGERGWWNRTSVGAGSGERWVIDAGEGITRLVETAVMSPEQFWVGRPFGR